jgi:hypothetical protein
MSRDEQRFQDLKTNLSEVGPFRRGSVQRRFMPCGKSGCRCQANPPELHGPYYQWTRKVDGKTVTVRLTTEQAQLVREWVANARRIDGLLAALEVVSLRLTQPLLEAAATGTGHRRYRRRDRAPSTSSHHRR